MIQQERMSRVFCPSSHLSNTSFDHFLFPKGKSDDHLEDAFENFQKEISLLMSITQTEDLRFQYLMETTFTKKVDSNTCPSPLQQVPEMKSPSFSGLELGLHESSSGFSTEPCSEIEEEAVALNPEKKRDWTESDDKTLMDIAIQYKYDWKRITKRLQCLSGKKYATSFLKRRVKILKKQDNVTRNKRFSHEEDLLLIRYYKMYGLDWCKISHHFEGRDPIMLKNRYYSFIRRKGLISKLTRELDNSEESQADDRKAHTDEALISLGN